MPEKTKLRIEAEKLCGKFPDTPSQTLARRLAKQFKTKLDNARSIVRIVRGQMGDRVRKKTTDKTHFRPAGKAGTVAMIPPSLAKPWLPFDLGKDIRVGILSDIHVPYHDVKAVMTAARHLKQSKCNVLLINGDGIDFYTISRYQKDPSQRNVKREIRMMREMLAYLSEQFPKARKVIKAGNHDERWDHYLWNHAPEICNLPQLRLKTILKCKSRCWEFVADQRPILAGKLPVFHGHELGKGISSPVNPARGAFMRTISTVLVGHHHRTSQHTEPNWKHEEIATYSTGCLCDLTPEYARVNKWNHGFAECEVAADGQFNLENFRITSEYTVRRS